MAPLIRAVLSNLVGDEAANEIEIIANDVTVFPDGTWDIKFRHPTRYEAYMRRRSTRLEFHILTK